MAHLHFHALFFCQGQKPAPFGDRFRDGFFQKNVFAGADGLCGQPVMRQGWRHNIHGINVLQHFSKGTEAADVRVQGQDGSRVFFIRIIKSCEFPAAGGEDAFEVDFAEVTYAEQADFELVHGGKNITS